MRSSTPEGVPSGDIQGGASGVKDDVSVILRGFANFFAPSPSSTPTRSSESESRGLVGIRNDLVEIGGSFKSSISRLSSNKAVSGISKFASQLLQFESQVVDDDQDGGRGVPGTNDDVVRFVKEISKRPDCWTDFPLPLDYADFSMSHPQRQHALTIEQLVPEFVALRLKLCSYMNVEKFWLIYFLLLLPRLNQRDFELLSTAKILEARSVLLKRLADKTTLQAENSENLRNLSPHQDVGNDSFTERDNISSDENLILGEITSATKCLEIDDDTMSSSARWFEDTDIGNSLAKFKQEEEDVSFSDLQDEDDDKSVISDCERLSGSREARDLIRVSSRDVCSDWDKLSENSERGGGGRQQKAVHLKGKDSEDESNDWFTVDHF
ncbi:uncharacterized protein LOC114725044 isoform X1 [Neltuma alba]|uniref:uncharacterized protein LOC114725044 isoform X1 n=1 Tax=Neltuma alba TaxID=207710 RepID=UPI0010A4AECD|nr:uncharacterized protein LOC114725044 isoform X1 [Prosopis alba]